MSLLDYLLGKRPLSQFAMHLLRNGNAGCWLLNASYVDVLFSECAVRFYRDGATTIVCDSESVQSQLREAMND